METITLGVDAPLPHRKPYFVLRAFLVSTRLTVLYLRILPATPARRDLVATQI
jgi:hypothetical protein